MIAPPRDMAEIKPSIKQKKIRRQNSKLSKLLQSC
jgi:hypothetical protein